MAMANGSAAEINVTPLIDVLLVLLIIFMVMVPQKPLGLSAEAPQPAKSLVEDPTPQAVVVQVRASKSGEAVYAINGSFLTKSGVERRLAEMFATRQEKTIFVKGDASLEFSSVAEVIDFAHRAGVQNVGIMTPRIEAGR